MMSEIIQQRRRFATGRRAFLGLAATGLAVPLGGMASGTMRAPRSSLQDALEHPPICRVAADTSLIAPGATPREVKMMWNSNAICTVGVPVAEHLGLFAKHNIKIEMVNVSGTVDQMLEALASGKVDAGCRHGLGLAEAARTRVRCKADRGECMADAFDCSPLRGRASLASPD